MFQIVVSLIEPISFPYGCQNRSMLTQISIILLNFSNTYILFLCEKKIICIPYCFLLTISFYSIYQYCALYLLFLLTHKSFLFYIFIFILSILLYFYYFYRLVFSLKFVSTLVMVAVLHVVMLMYVFFSNSYFTIYHII